MKKNRNLVFGAILVVLYFLTYVHAADSNLTPRPGNPLRKLVLDALRQEVKRIHGLDVVFVVRHLKVKNGWGWVHTMPQSPDGSNRYEDVSALLRLQDGGWRVVEIPCGEEGNPNCLNAPDYFSGLQERFPNVSTEVFPDWASEVKN